MHAEIFEMLISHFLAIKNMRTNWTHVTCVGEICERDAELKRDNTSGSGPCIKMQVVMVAIAYLLLSSLNLANGEEKGLSKGQIL